MTKHEAMFSTWNSTFWTIGPMVSYSITAPKIPFCYFYMLLHVDQMAQLFNTQTQTTHGFKWTHIQSASIINQNHWYLFSLSIHDNMQWIIMALPLFSQILVGIGNGKHSTYRSNNGTQVLKCGSCGGLNLIYKIHQILALFVWGHEQTLQRYVCL